MATEQMMVLQPMANGRSVTAGAVATDLSGSSEDSEAFQQALLQRLDGRVPAAQAVAGEPSLPPPTLSTTEADAGPLAGLIEQIKVLAGQAAVGAVAESESESGNQGVEAGNILPGTEQSASDSVVLTPEQLEQLASQFMPAQTPPESGTKADLPVSPEAAQGCVAPGLPPTSTLSAFSSEKAGVGAGDRHSRAAMAIDDMTGALTSPGSPVAETLNTAVASSAPGFEVPGVSAPAISAPAPAPSSAPGGTPAPLEAQASVTATVLSTAGDSGGGGSNVRPMSFSESANAVDQRVTPAELGSLEDKAVNVVHPNALAEPAKATSSASGAPLPMAGLSLPTGLLDAVASEFAKFGDGTQPAAPAVQGTDPVAPLTGGELMHPEISTMPQNVIPQTASTPAGQRPDVPAVNTFLGQPGWSDDLGQRVVWMTGKGMQSAELQLNPQHLGPVEVRINMAQDQASIQFVSHHAGVREAIEAAIPKLREMLGAQNLNLADVSVTQQSFSDHRDYRGAQQAYDQQSQSGRQGHSSPADRFGGAVSASHADGEQAITRHSGRGLLSLYA